MRLNPDIGRTISAGISRFMCTGRPVRLFAKVNEEVFTQCHTAILNIAIDDEHLATLVLDVRIELIVPSGKQRRRDVKPFAIE